MAEALRTTYWVPQMGSKLARSACGTKRSVRAAARCEIAGLAKEPATERAPAPATDFRNALRSMMVPSIALSRRGQIPCRIEDDSHQERRPLLVNGINKRPVFNMREVAP